MIKKFLLFLVEGKNDELEINAILHSPFFDKVREKYQYYFLPNNGDLTSSSGVSSKNVQQKLNDILLDFRKRGVPFNNIKVSEIAGFVHIVDIDGCFIPADRIKKGSDSAFIYTDDTIITSNVDGAIGRNKKKAGILSKLSTINLIGNVPYKIYYVSCNMDHLLFNRRMLNPREKTAFAYKFINDCSGRPDILNDSFFREGIMASGTYEESWTFIQEGLNSLNRHTNFNLFFSRE